MNNNDLYSHIQSTYDAVAAEYADGYFDELQQKPFDRALLGEFADSVGVGQVCDIGCGPGHIARFLQDRGVASFGLDLSHTLLAQARQLNTAMPFVQADMRAIPLQNDVLAGITAFYCIIHLPRADVIIALREMRRVLRSGGKLLLAFHGGEGEVTSHEWFGKDVSVIATLFSMDEMTRLLESAGFQVETAQERDPYDFEYPSQRMYVVAEKG